MLGSHVVANVADSLGLGEQHGIDQTALVRKLHGAPRVARVALELWCAGLWERHEDDDLWERECAWLASDPG